MGKKIALIGTGSTGKSTVMNLLLAKIPSGRFVSESTRKVASYGYPINENGTDQTQLAISSFHLEALLIPNAFGPTFYDRCYLDLVVYSRYMPNISKNTLQFIEDTWERVKGKYDYYVYFPIEFNLVKDGVRSDDEEWRAAIDREFQTLIADLPNVIIVTGSPDERVDQIQNILQEKVNLN